VSKNFNWENIENLLIAYNVSSETGQDSKIAPFGPSINVNYEIE